MKWSKNNTSNTTKKWKLTTKTYQWSTPPQKGTIRILVWKNRPTLLWRLNSSKLNWNIIKKNILKNLTRQGSHPNRRCQSWKTIHRWKGSNGTEDSSTKGKNFKKNLSPKFRRYKKEWVNRSFQWIKKFRC